MANKKQCWSDEGQPCKPKYDIKEEINNEEIESYVIQY